VRNAAFDEIAPEMMDDHRVGSRAALTDVPFADESPLDEEPLAGASSDDKPMAASSF
jgi:hypothetical protein